MEAQRLSLFDDDPATRLAGLMSAMKAAMNRAADECRDLSREQIAERMTSLAKRAGTPLNKNAKVLSLAVLEKWLNPADMQHKPSIEALSVFCQTVGDMRPLAVLLAVHGCGVMTPEDRRLRDYAAADLAEKDARKRKKQLEARIR